VLILGLDDVDLDLVTGVEGDRLLATCRELAVRDDSLALRTDVDEDLVGIDADDDTIPMSPWARALIEFWSSRRRSSMVSVSGSWAVVGVNELLCSYSCLQNNPSRRSGSLAFAFK
jgi:hypothetical protein